MSYSRFLGLMFHIHIRMHFQCMTPSYTIWNVVFRLSMLFYKQRKGKVNCFQFVAAFFCSIRYDQFMWIKIPAVKHYYMSSVQANSIHIDDMVKDHKFKSFFVVVALVVMMWEKYFSWKLRIFVTAFVPFFYYPQLPSRLW